MATEEDDGVQRLPPDARLDSLDARLDRAQRLEAERTGAAQPDTGTRIGQTLFGHLIGAPFGGGLIGWGLDHWFKTFPLMFLVMLFFGFGVGVRNVMRISKTRSGAGPDAGS